MNRDELLDKLAMELAEWPIAMLPPNLPGLWSCHHGWRCQARGDAKQIFGHDWLQRRQELINCPPDSEAPEGYNWKCQDADGLWKFTDSKPVFATDDSGCELSWWVAGVHESLNFGEVPAGHDWRTTLSRINRDDNTSTAEEEAEFDRIQARQDADDVLDQDIKAFIESCAVKNDLKYNPDSVAFSSEDGEKQPRYLDADGEDWIDEFARTATLDEFRGAMRFTIGKYNRRVGRKDEVLKEVRKIKDYCARWEAYELSLSNQ